MARRRKRSGRTTSKDPQLNADPPASSRLKRRRRVQEPEQTRVLQNSAPALPAHVPEQLSRLNIQCASLCQETGTDGERNNTLLGDIVRQCADLLSTVDVSVVLEKAPLVPQVLRLAMNDPNSSTEALTKSLVIFASKFASDNTAKDPFDANIPTAKSEVVAAAANWAVLMLLRCLSLTCAVPTRKCCQAHMRVLVGPRDEMRSCVIERARANLSYTAESLRTDRTGLMTGSVDSTISHSLQRPGIGILNNVLRRIMDEPRSPSTAEHSILILDSISKILVRNNGALFDELSLDDRANLLYVSDSVYDWFVQRLQERSTPNSSWESLSRETEALSFAARKHIVLHWKLLDLVREAIGAQSKEFKQSWWRAQTWLRVTLGQVMDNLQAKEIGERVPPGLRLCLRQTAILVHAMRTGETVELGVRAAQVLYDGMRLAKRLTLGRNEHAILLACEPLIVRALWACGLQIRAGGQSATSAAQIGTALVVSCNVDRVVGGRAAENDGQLRAVQDGLIRAMLAPRLETGPEKVYATNIFQAAIMIGCGGRDTRLPVSHTWEQSWLASVSNVR